MRREARRARRGGDVDPPGAGPDDLVGEDVEVAQFRDDGPEAAGLVDQAGGRRAVADLAEDREGAAQPPQADAQLVRAFRIVGLLHHRHVAGDLGEAGAQDRPVGHLHRVVGPDLGLDRLRRADGVLLLAAFGEPVAALGLGDGGKAHGHGDERLTGDLEQGATVAALQLELGLGDRQALVAGDDLALVHRIFDLVAGARHQRAQGALDADLEQGHQPAVADGRAQVGGERGIVEAVEVGRLAVDGDGQFAPLREGAERPVGGLHGLLDEAAAPAQAQRHGGPAQRLVGRVEIGGDQRLAVATADRDVVDVPGGAQAGGLARLQREFQFRFDLSRHVATIVHPRPGPSRTPDGSGRARPDRHNQPCPRRRGQFAAVPSPARRRPAGAQRLCDSRHDFAANAPNGRPDLRRGKKFLPVFAHARV